MKKSILTLIVVFILFSFYSCEQEEEIVHEEIHNNNAKDPTEGGVDEVPK